MSIPNIKLV